MALHSSCFFSTGNVSPRELSGLPCLGIQSFTALLRLVPSPPKRPGYLVAQAFGQQYKTDLLSRHCHLCTRKARTKTLSLRPCQAKGEDSERGLSSLDAESLERQLHIAIAEENYAEAAKIRDSLKLLNEDGKSSILSANARFYEAFKAGDLAAMQNLWAKSEQVCCVHPGARGISGYDDVITSWEYVWANYEFPLAIELKDVKVQVRGDMGFVTCVELVSTQGSSWGGQFVTNVFEKIDDQWLICVHHASPIDL